MPFIFELLENFLAELHAPLLADGQHFSRNPGTDFGQFPTGWGFVEGNDFIQLFLSQVFLVDGYHHGGQFRGGRLGYLFLGLFPVGVRNAGSLLFEQGEDAGDRLLQYLSRTGYDEEFLDGFLIIVRLGRAYQRENPA